MTSYAQVAAEFELIDLFGDIFVSGDGTLRFQIRAGYGIGKPSAKEKGASLSGLDVHSGELFRCGAGIPIDTLLHPGDTVQGCLVSARGCTLHWHPPSAGLPLAQRLEEHRRSELVSDQRASAPMLDSHASGATPGNTCTSGGVLYQGRESATGSFSDTSGRLFSTLGVGGSSSGGGNFCDRAVFEYRPSGPFAIQELAPTPELGEINFLDSPAQYSVEHFTNPATLARTAMDSPIWAPSRPNDTMDIGRGWGSWED